MDIIDPMLKEGASKVELETMRAIGNLATACLNERTKAESPSMQEVAEEIEYVISIVTGEASKTKKLHVSPIPNYQSLWFVEPQDKLVLVAIAD
ncbi:Hypothetical predicted protein [Olea europaea subsp. europaea]|uniref:Uncharacterized protein n=1 Tax=Olea europaea subsp. europaea TaxID=158383 RepID=A0A8S0PL33_OLEEU|nr:Hypothetical predicted protein [Olea europaea subsp. europaea]